MLVDHLKRGRNNAVTEAVLAAALHVDPRDISKMAQRERKAGFPICAASSPPCGLYLAETPEELAHYAKRLDHRLREVHATREALGNTLDTWTGQTRIEAWDRVDQWGD